jgi:hypothetical protein
MLARSGRLPDEDGYAYERKWDGLGAIVRCKSEFCVGSRRGWNVGRVCSSSHRFGGRSVDGSWLRGLIGYKRDSLPPPWRGRVPRPS